MIVNDLLLISEGRVIALDAMNGKTVFDTHKNTKEYVSKFNNRNILDIWSDVKLKQFGYSRVAEPAICIYVSHDDFNGIILD